MLISTATTKALLAKIAGLRVLVVGDVMLDHYIWGDASRISPEAPVPVVDIDRDTWTAGGAANVALNIAALGARCTVAGYFGRDEAGEKLRLLLKERGIEPVSTPGEALTIVKTRVLVQHQQLCRLDRESRPEAYAVEAGALGKLLAESIASSDVVILSDYAKGLLSGPVVARIARLARAGGKFLALDPKPRRKLAFDHFDLITPNKREALQLAGLETDPHAPFPEREVCARIHALHRTKNLVITLGEDGMLLSRGGRVLKTIPTAAREVFDVSGAGDTSLAALALALSSGAGLEAAALFANAAAGVVVGKLGTATVTPKELLEHLSEAP